jgi:hypothetical protein
VSGDAERIIRFTVDLPYYGKPEHGEKILKSIVKEMALVYPRAEVTRIGDPKPKKSH